MELFLHPWYMIAGGILVSAPIIIHLINRMRFKRIRWAAMEFLLKSQKKNQRRLIIEQLLLLLLRILMVLLVAFLVARFVGSSLASASTGTLHYVVVDDTHSMGDRHVKEGATVVAFDTGRGMVKDLCENAATKSAGQYIKVVLLSELAAAASKTPRDTVKYLLDEQIGDRTADNVERALAAVKPTVLHVPPHVGLGLAREEAIGTPQGQKIIHFVSDFRETDWASGPYTAELTKTVEGMLGSRISLSLLDTAHPFRKDVAGVTQWHDNLCIASFKGDSRIVPEGVYINFEITIRNNGTKNVSPQLFVQVDGRDENRASAFIPSVSPGQEHTHRFDLRFEKKTKAPVEYVHLRAWIKPSETALEADHVRDLVLELRSKIPVLIIDGKGADGSKPGGDTFFLSEGINATGSYVAVTGEVTKIGNEERTKAYTVADLKTLPLDTFAAIYLLNVRRLDEKDDEPEIATRLKQYVEKGGNLAFFLGPQIEASYYNDVLHLSKNLPTEKKLDGLFPALIDLQPTPPLELAARSDMLQNDPQKKILYRDKSHPIVQKAFVDNGVLHLVIIDRYHRVQSKSQWTPNAQKEVVEILTLPSTEKVGNFKNRAQEAVQRMIKEVKELAETDKSVEKYVLPPEGGGLSVLDQYDRAIRAALTKEYLYELTQVLDYLLNDPGDPPPDPDKPEEANKPRRPSMAELWSRPQLRSVATELRQMLDSALYGDPLLIGRPYGKGKVVAFLSSAGPQAEDQKTQWNRLAAGDPGSSATFIPLVAELQLYLTSQMDTQNRLVTAGSPEIKFAFPATQYDQTLQINTLPQPNFKAADGGQAVQEKPLATASMTKVGEDKDERFTYTFTDGRKLGVVVFEATRKNAEAGAEKERILYAFNVDPDAESNLARAPRERLDKSLQFREKMKEARMYYFEPGDRVDIEKEKDPDASESPWLYLLILIILIVEQALAVHLSFHLKGNESNAPATRSSSQAATA